MKRAAKAAPRPPEYRALMRFEELPVGHKTLLVRDDGAAPHLQPGEFAVVDTSDREPQHGELYVVQWNNGARQIVQVLTAKGMLIGRAKAQGWWLGDLAGFRNVGSVDNSLAAGLMGNPLASIPLFAGLRDGPYTSPELIKKLVGRIVGYADGGLGDELAGRVCFPF